MTDAQQPVAEERSAAAPAVPEGAAKAGDAAAPAGAPAAAPPGDDDVQAAAGAPGADEAGLFGAWAGISGGLNSLFGGEQEASTEETPKQSPSLLPLKKAASDMAASATSELESASKAAQLRLGQAAQGIERGWGTFNSFLDDILSPPVGEDGARTAAESASGAPPRSAGGAAIAAAMERAADALHERFPALSGEEAVDVYECSLVQKYRCALNAATPEKTFALAGVLYVTAAHLAMYVVDDGGAFGAPFGVVVPLADVKRVQRGSKAMLRVVTEDKSSYVFAGFASDDTFKAAVDLLHHLVDTDDNSRDATTNTETA